MSRKPYTHVCWALALALCGGILLTAGGVTQQPANAATGTDADPSATKPSQAPVAPAPPPAPNLETFTTQVQPGDSLSAIFARHGLAARDLHLLVESGRTGRQLETIHPGQHIEFGRDAEKNLVHVRYRQGRWRTLEFQRVGDEFEASTQFKQPEAIQSYRHGKIDHSLSRACRTIDLNDAFAMELAEIFKWDVDMFHVQKGDEFHVLFEEHLIDGEFVDFGAILAAEFESRRKTFRAVRYVHSDGKASYYNPTGDNLRKAFLSAPLDYSRISSNFNLNRVHPLWKSTMPHRGIDYAARTGTPVKAAGAGTVTTRSKSPSKGNYVVIQHGTRYQTKYLHLSRFAKGIEAGTPVEQGQVIGYVGATGWATGPHLHYEFLVDGRHTNPRTVPLPSAESIDAAERSRFHASTTQLLDALDDHKQTRRLAYLSPLVPSAGD